VHSYKARMNAQADSGQMKVIKQDRKMIML